MIHGYQTRRMLGSERLQHLDSPALLCAEIKKVATFFISARLSVLE
jgi:hypothetical protein